MFHKGRAKIMFRKVRAIICLITRKWFNEHKIMSSIQFWPQLLHQNFISNFSRMKNSFVRFLIKQIVPAMLAAFSLTFYPRPGLTVLVLLWRRQNCCKHCQKLFVCFWDSLYASRFAYWDSFLPFWVQSICKQVCRLNSQNTRSFDLQTVYIP